MGGYEFVMVCSGLDKKSVEARIPELRDAVSGAGAQICGEGLLGASFGAAVFPEDSKSADELLAAADRKMYRDKKASKGAASAPSDGAIHSRPLRRACLTTPSLPPA